MTSERNLTTSILRWATAILLCGPLIEAFAADSHAGHDHGAAGHAHAATAAFGEPGDPAKVVRTVSVTMLDTMRFEPEIIEVRQGETIRIALANPGKVRHELVLGTAEGLRRHAEAMRGAPAMKHDEPNGAEVDPGKQGALVWRFTRAGTFDFACLQPGHYEAGMKGKVVVRR
jgi:uncharacterized cupredoxin-like copper-binding protein